MPISRLITRIIGAIIDGPGDDSEFDQIINTSNSHETSTTQHGATGAVVGLTNSQTLTNKTLQSCTITSSPTAAGATWVNLGTVTTAIFTAFNYSQPQTRYLGVDASALRGSTSTHDTFISYNSVWLINSDGAFAAHTYLAPIFLPHGAVITQFRMYYRREDTASSIVATLYRQIMLGGTETLASVEGLNTFGNGTFADDDSIANATVDNTTYAYYIGITIDNNNSTTDTGLSAFRVTYTVLNPLS